MDIPRFHLAFPVHNLEQARVFYVDTLGCGTGRHSDKWIDFDLYGHQVVAHLAPEDCRAGNKNEVDGDHVPSSHFGVILLWEKWKELSEIIINKEIEFLIKPNLEKYLESVIGGINYYLRTNKIVPKNNFGEHNWFSKK